MSPQPTSRPPPKKIASRAATERTIFRVGKTLLGSVFAFICRSLPTKYPLIMQLVNQNFGGKVSRYRFFVLRLSFPTILDDDLFFSINFNSNAHSEPDEINFLFSFDNLIELHPLLPPPPKKKKKKRESFFCFWFKKLLKSFTVMKSSNLIKFFYGSFPFFQEISRTITIKSCLYSNMYRTILSFDALKLLYRFSLPKVNLKNF